MFPRTEEARGSNPLTSTIRNPLPSQGVPLRRGNDLNRPVWQNPIRTPNALEILGLFGPMLALSPPPWSLFIRSVGARSGSGCALLIAELASGGNEPLIVSLRVTLWK